MTVDYFLIDGPHSVPVEFQAWAAAKDRYMAIFRAWGAAAADSDERAKLDRQAERPRPWQMTWSGLHARLGIV